MEEITNLNTVDEIIDYFNLFKSYWTIGVENKVNFNSLNGWAFRGQEEAKWGLVPSAFRFKNGYTNLTNYLYLDLQRKLAADFHPGTIESGQLSYPDLQERCDRDFINHHRKYEAVAVYNFILMADRLGIPTPIDYQTASEIKTIADVVNWEYSLHNVNAGMPFDAFPPMNLSESFALAQHHGIPTRFLDWTQHPFVALYFAAKPIWDVSKMEWEEKVEQWNNNDAMDNYMAVWALNTRENNPYTSSQIKIVTAAYSRNGYLKAQSGLFTLDTIADNNFDGTWKNQENVLSEKLRKVLIKKSFAKDILKRLFLKNISPVHISPSLDNIKTSYTYYRELFLDYRQGAHDTISYY